MKSQCSRFKVSRTTRCHHNESGWVTRQDTNLIQMTENKVHLIAATVILSQDIQPFIWLVNKLTKFRRTNKDWGVGIDIRRPGQCLMPHIHPPSHFLKHAVISFKTVETQTSLTDTCAMKPRGCIVWLEKPIQDHVFVYHMNCLISHYHMIYCTSIGLVLPIKKHMNECPHMMIHSTKKGTLFHPDPGLVSLEHHDKFNMTNYWQVV